MCAFIKCWESSNVGEKVKTTDGQKGTENEYF